MQPNPFVLPILSVTEKASFSESILKTSTDIKQNADLLSDFKKNLGKNTPVVVFAEMLGLEAGVAVTVLNMWQKINALTKERGVFLEQFLKNMPQAGNFLSGYNALCQESNKKIRQGEWTHHNWDEEKEKFLTHWGIKKEQFELVDWSITYLIASPDVSRLADANEKLEMFLALRKYKGFTKKPGENMEDVQRLYKQELPQAHDEKGRYALRMQLLDGLGIDPETGSTALENVRQGAIVSAQRRVLD